MSNIKKISLNQLNNWLFDNQLLFNIESGAINFRSTNCTFRIPIQDYMLQLDYRIQAAMEFFDPTQSILIFRKWLKWDLTDLSKMPLNFTLKAMSFESLEGAYLIEPENFRLLLTIAYLTNRWGSNLDGLYFIQEKKPSFFLYFPGSPESVFCTCNNLDFHDRCLYNLGLKNIPAYGKFISNPLKEPIYEDFQVGTSRVKVDRKTGRPIGLATGESVLYPEYLPPLNDD